MIDYIATLRRLQIKADDESSRLMALAKEYSRLLAIEAGGTVEGLTLTESQRGVLGTKRLAIEEQVAVLAGIDYVSVEEKL